MQQLILVLAFICVCSTTYPQPPTGLQAWRDSSLADTIRLEELERVNWRDYVREKPDSSIVLARAQLVLAQKIGSEIYEAKAHTLLGSVARSMGDLKGSRSHHEEALRIAEKIGSPQGISAELNHLGRLHLILGEMENAIALFTRSIQVASSSGDRRAKAFALMNVGSLFLQSGDQVTALKYYEESLVEGRAMNDPSIIAKALSASGGMLFDRGEEVAGLERLEQGLRMFEEANDRWGAMEAMINIGVVHLRSGRSAEALRLFNGTLDIANEMNDLEGQLVALSSLADAYMKEPLYRPATAISYGRRALEKAEQLGQKEWKAQVCKILYTAYKELGDHAKALAMFETLTALEDSIMSTENQRALIRADLRSGFEKEALVDSLMNAQRLSITEGQLVLESLRADRNRNRALLLTGATVLLALIALLLYRSMRNRQRLALQQKELHDQEVDQLLAQQELKSINAMLEGQEKERDRVGKDLHDRLGSMLSGIKSHMAALEDRVDAMRQDQQYQKVNRLLDQTVSELRQISHDMAAATLSRFGLEKALGDLRDTLQISGRLHVELIVFGLERRLERGVEIALYRMVQELVSNVLKHASASELSIAVTRAPGRLSVVVSDNGVGFDTAQQINGMGLGNVLSRATSLGATVQVDSTPGKGTTVSVECPVVE